MGTEPSIVSPHEHPSRQVLQEAQVHPIFNKALFIPHVHPQKLPAEAPT